MPTFLTARWSNLIMAQYEVAPNALLPWLPHGVTLDLFEGRCYVSLVGFLFHRVRLKGIAIPFHTQFEEINLRFYVKRQETDGSVRRGVVFVREFVPRPAITWVARTFYEEPYVTVPTEHRIVSSAEILEVGYRWKYGRQWHSLEVTASAAPQAIAPGSEEEFLTEHYWGYTRRSNATTSAYEVRHPRWNAYTVKGFRVEADLERLYGAAFGRIDAASPASVLLAEGSEVTVEDALNGRIQ